MDYFLLLADLLTSAYILIWITRDISFIFSAEVHRVNAQEVILSWRRAPRWFIKRQHKKREQQLIQSVQKWLRLFAVTTQIIHLAAPPAIGLFLASAAGSAMRGPGFWNTLSFIVDLGWAVALAFLIKNDSNWRRRAKKAKERIVATWAGLKVVPVRSAA